MPIRALIGCIIEHKALKQVIAEFEKIPEITKVFALTGDMDVLAEIVVDSTEELYEIFSTKIDLIEGIKETNTHLVMNSWEK